MTPLRGAVNFVDAYHGDLAAELGEILDKEPLRRDKEHLDLLLSKGLEHSFLGMIGLLRVDGSSSDEGGKLLQLVCH